jgi:hypothetical protein
MHPRQATVELFTQKDCGFGFAWRKCGKESRNRIIYLLLINHCL